MRKKSRTDTISIIITFVEHVRRISFFIFNLAHGWEPSCKFLGKPIPSEPFPHLNDTEDFKGRIAKVNLVGITIFSIGVTVASMLALAFYY